MQITTPKSEIDRIVSFLRSKYDELDKPAVIAVSGGIDSALSLTLLTKALGAKRITPLFLPYGEQSVEDSYRITKFNGFLSENVVIINIKDITDCISKHLNPDKFRLGNIMARVRMMILYDIAKQKNALVCGTENKSENYLGYFTRFGDEASDIEPIVHLYKTQIRQLASYLKLPKEIIEKDPSAGLWEDQTDELELGFSYRHADLILSYLEKEQLLTQIPKLKTQMSKIKTIAQSLELDSGEVQKVIDRIELVAFKHEVPYTLDKNNEIT